MNSSSPVEIIVARDELKRRTQRNATDSSLLRLPGELRNNIYEYALESPVLRITCGHDHSFNYDYPSLADVLQRLPQEQPHCGSLRGVPTPIITLTMIDRVVFWVSQLEKQTDDQKATRAELDDA
ncbi:hypothetical protein E8E11_000211 [Didymella keratinophila]|nr:hypothetical protein E8E11_000211 [Didymella keratinophila]